MRLLFDDELAPLTSHLCFIEADFESVVDEYLRWMSPILRRSHLRRKVLNENFRDTLLRLLPITVPVDVRNLFIPTKSKWTAFFDNGLQGTDRSPVSVLAKRLCCRGIYSTAVPHTFPSRITRETRGRFGATIMEIFGQDGEYVRAINCANDGGKWVFEESGEPYEFEDLELYKARRIRDRFTPEILERYLKNFGIDVFNEDFYLESGSNRSIMVVREDEDGFSYTEYTLSEVREGVPWWGPKK